jgi:FkbM family methyltransferase
MGLVEVLKGILNHPFNRGNKIGAIIRFVNWQVKSRCFPTRLFVHKLSKQSKMYAKQGMTGVTGCIYNGLLEYDDMLFLLHFLRKEDTFLDIGSNVGVYSVLASAEVGAETIAFEPIPSTFEILQKNLALNGLQSDRVHALNLGLGSQEGSLAFTKSEDTVNDVATEQEISSGDILQVPVGKLDDVLEKYSLKDVVFMKIDVEGFETEVLRGGSGLLNDKRLQAVIIELNGSGERYGYDENWIHELFLSNGFSPYSYEPSTRELTKLDAKLSYHNTIYLRNEEFVIERLSSAKRVEIQGVLL